MRPRNLQRQDAPDAGAIQPATAKARVHGPAEVAFLDLREAGAFADGHPLFAIPCPFSTLELRVETLVPRRDVPILLIDAGDGVAQHAATLLRDMGYDAVSWIDGGLPAWSAAGFGVFAGVNVPSKTLGELVEEALHPPTIDVETLVRWRAEGRRVHLFDARPAEEYAHMRLPGAVCLPNGELAHRFEAAVDADAEVVVTCAGRTRGIIGVAGLALAGLTGRIHALENGTQGWALAGQPLERGNRAAPFPTLDAKAQQATRARADALATREGIGFVDAAQAQDMRAQPDRTTYLLDVRSPQDWRADPLPAFVPAASGQLVQATDRWVGVRRSRLVLADDLGLRGVLAALWLRRLGYDAHVLRIDDAARALPAPNGAMAPAPWPRLSARDSVRMLRRGDARMLDVRSSQAFRAGHVEGASWTIRPYLLDAPRVPGRVILLGDSPAQADLAAATLALSGAADIHVLDGDLAALRQAGASIVASADTPSDEDAIDFIRFAHGRHDGDLAASRLYLDWEQGLIAQLDPAERAEFRI